MMEALLPVVSPEDLAERDRVLRGYLSVLVPGVDYDPGGRDGLFDKPSLLQPGAEKLAVAFGLRLVPRISHRDEDLAGDRFGEPYVLVEATVDAFYGGELVGAGIGLATSLDPAHRYRWVTAPEVPAGLALTSLQVRESSISEPLFAVEKAETGGKWGKPAAYWKQFHDAIAAGKVERFQRDNKAGKATEWVSVSTTLYRVPNPDVFGLLNSILKMAVKRAKVAAVISSIGGLPALFTRDLEDMPAGTGRPQTSARPRSAPAPAPAPAPAGSPARKAEPQSAPNVPAWPSVVHDPAMVLTPAVWGASGLTARMVKEPDGRRRPVVMAELTEAEMTALAGMRSDDAHVIAVADAAAEALQAL